MKHLIKGITAAILMVPLFVCFVPVAVFGWIGAELSKAICWLTEE